jgi:hypothetical protein
MSRLDEEIEWATARLVQAALAAHVAEQHFTRNKCDFPTYTAARHDREKSAARLLKLQARKAVASQSVRVAEETTPTSRADDALELTRVSAPPALRSCDLASMSEAKHAAE